MIEIDLNTLEKALEECFDNNFKDFIKPLGNGLYQINGNLICGEAMLEEIFNEMKK